MDNLLSFEFLFSNLNNSNKLSKNEVNKKFDEFIKESFANYLYSSAIFNKYAKIYDLDSNFTDECKDIYILSEQLYLNAIQKINIPFDIKFNKTNNLYIFNLNDIHNNEFIFKDSSEGRIFRPKKQKYLCKIIALIFVKLYILIKGIYTTFNHNLTYQEFISSKKNSNSEQEPSSAPETNESSSTPETNESSSTPETNESSSTPETNESSSTPETIESYNLQTGGKLFDTFKEFFKSSSKDNELDDELDEEFYDKELNKISEKEQDDDNENNDDEQDDDDDDDDKDNDENISIKLPNKEIKYYNIFFAFMNSIFGKDFKQKETYINMEFPNNLEMFIKNLKNSGMFDILCDTDYIYNAFKKNILFNKNSMNKVYETSPNILLKIKKIENEFLSQYNFDLEEKDKKLKSRFKKLQKYNNLCNKIHFQSDLNIKDETRIYERIIKIIKQMFTNYTSNRNKLFNEIILKVFEFKEKIIKDENGSIKEIKNNIIRIKDNITYTEIIKLTSNAKVIIYDLHI